MNWEEYVEFTRSRWAPLVGRHRRIHAAMLLAGEASEAAELTKKEMFKSSFELSLEDMKEELGDVAFGLARMLDEYGLDLWDVLEHNREKLKDGHGYEVEED